jgi:hypothetical protein
MSRQRGSGESPHFQELAMLSILAMFVGLIFCGIGFKSDDRAGRLIFWILGAGLIALGIFSLTRGGVHFT